MDLLLYGEDGGSLNEWMRKCFLDWKNGSLRLGRDFSVQLMELYEHGKIYLKVNKENLNQALKASNQTVQKV